MFNQQQPSPQEQLAALKDQLLEAFVQKDNAESALKAANEKIAAIRNVLAGVPLGEAVVESKKAPEAAPVE